MRLNLRFLVQLTAVLCIIALVIVVLHRAQANRSTTLILAQARDARDSEDLEEAVRLYSRCVGLGSAATDVRIEYANCLAKIGEYDDAYLQLEAALRADDSLSDPRRDLVEVSMKMGRFVDAKEQLENHLLPPDPENVEYLRLLAEIEDALGEYDQAKTLLESAIEAAPTSSEATEDLARLLTDRFSLPQEAQKHLDALVETAGDRSESYLVRAQWRFERAKQIGDPRLTQQLLNLAAEDLLEASSRTPGNTRCALLAAQVATGTRKTEFASQVLSAAIEADPSEPRLYGAAAQLELLKGNTDEALQRLREGLRNAPGQADLIWNLASLEIESGTPDNARDLVIELRSIGFLEAPVRYLEARLLVLENEWRRAATLIENSRSLFDRSDPELLKRSDILLSVCYEKLGRTDLELAALRRAVAVDPLWGEARQALAFALTRAGRIREAVTELGHVVRQESPPINAVVSLTRLTLLRWLQTNSPTDRGHVEQLLRRLEETPEAAVDAAILRAELLFAGGDTKRASELLQAQIKSHPDSIPLYQASIELLLRGKEFEAAAQQIDLAENQIGDSAVLRLERAKYLIRRYGKQDRLSELEELAIPKEEWTASQRVQLAGGFAAIFLSLDDYERCSEQAKRLNQEESGQFDLRLQLLLFDLAFRSNDAAGMGSTLDRIKLIEGEGPLWHVGEAIRIALQPSNPNYGPAIEHLSLAGVARPAWSRVPRLKAEIHERAGDSDLAIQHYLDAFSLGEQDPRIIARGVFLLFKRGRFIEADKVVRRLQEQRVPFSYELTQVASQVSLQLENFDRALSLARERAKESGKQEDLIWLAQVLRIMGDREAAEREFRSAIALAPTAPAAWVSLVQMHSRHGDRAAAETAISEARVSIGPNHLADALAQCYQSLGEDDTAREFYREAIVDAPDDAGIIRRFATFLLERGRQDEAIPLLEQLVSDSFVEQSVDQAWARRNLALAIGFEGDVSGFARAKQLIETNLKQTGDSIEDRRCLAILFARHGRPGMIDQAIQLLAKVTPQQARFSITDNALLADLYLRRGDWTGYCRTMRSVLGNGGAEQIGYVSKYATALVDHGELIEARLWWERLVELAPDSPPTRTIEAQILFAESSYESLESKLREAASSPELKPWAADVSEVYGVRLFRSGRKDDALPLIRLAMQTNEALAESDDGGGLRLATFHARVGSIKTSLDLLPEAPIEPRRLTELAHGAMQSGQADSDQIRQLAKRVNLALTRNPDHPGLLVCLGDLHSWTGDCVKACDAYEMALRKNPSNLMALNNMAMICALTGNRLAWAESAIDSAIRETGMSAVLLDTRGMIRLARGYFEAAESDFRAALGNSDEAQLQLHLTQALIAQRKYREAEESWKQMWKAKLNVESLYPLEKESLKQVESSLKSASPEIATRDGQRA